jgi:metal-dependent amidase/aminoacylase/carboxypeptidase family protein
MKNNLTLARLFQKNMAALGRRVPMSAGEKSSGSTDIGNVSQLIPAIHPTVTIAPDTTLIHTPEFARVAAMEDALRRMLEAAKAMAMTAVDLLASPETLAKVQADFRKGG